MSLDPQLLSKPIPVISAIDYGPKRCQLVYHRWHQYSQFILFNPQLFNQKNPNKNKDKATIVNEFSNHQLWQTATELTPTW